MVPYISGLHREKHGLMFVRAEFTSVPCLHRLPKMALSSPLIFTAERPWRYGKGRGLSLTLQLQSFEDKRLALCALVSLPPEALI